MCESGARYGELAGGGFANTCVPQDTSDGTGTGTGTGPEPTSSVQPTTTGLSTSAGSSSETRTLAESSTSPPTGGPAECEILFRDDSEGATLFPDWEMAGPGMVDFSGGRVGLIPPLSPGTSQPGFAARRRSASRGDGFGWTSMTSPARTACKRSSRWATRTRFNLSTSYSTPAPTRSPRASGIEEGFTDLLAVPFEKFEPPWVGLREADGQVIFERGVSEDDIVPFFAIDADVTGWLGRLHVGADSFIELTSRGDEVSFEEVAACVVR